MEDYVSDYLVVIALSRIGAKEYATEFKHEFLCVDSVEELQRLAEKMVSSNADAKYYRSVSIFSITKLN
jgi:hypothetical protein